MECVGSLLGPVQKVSGSIRGSKQKVMVKQTPEIYLYTDMVDLITGYNRLVFCFFRLRSRSRR